MLFRSFILALCWLFIPPVYGSVNGECESALKTLFASKITKSEASEFLRLQGDLTLHRLAWAYLKAQESDQSEALENVERTILTLLDEKYTSTDPEFIKARDAFESQPLSRTTLSEIAPYLKDILAKDFPESDKSYILNASDLKILHTIAKFEKRSATNGIYKTSMLDSKSEGGMLNFLKLINSSYKKDQSHSEKELSIEMKLSGLEKNLQSMQERLNNFLNEISLPSQCTDIDICDKNEFSELFGHSEDLQNIFWTSLEEKLLSDDLILDELTYGELWLKTGTSPVSIPNQGKQRQTVIGQKVKVSSVSPVTTYYTSRTGMVIENPINIIVKDGQGRKAENWKNLETDFVQSMSDAILADEKVFVYHDKIYDRKTGKYLKPESALELIPPAARAEFKKTLKWSDPKLAVKQMMAKVNGDRTLIYNNTLYNLKGEKVSAEWAIGHVMTTKTGTKHDPSRYKGLERTYLVARANSLMNNKPHFVVKNQVYDTETGRQLSSPFRSIAGNKDVKIDKERRILYQSLSDKETIINYHRDHPRDGGCQHYAIVDKKNANISVYTLSGVQVFSTEVLVGKKVSDAKTRWTEYSDREHLASGTTGAGAFTIGQPKMNDDLKNKYSNNILQVEGQKVFAIHQVPNNLQSRYHNFGTGNPSDRRVSGGCVNLKQSDFLKLEDWIKPSCKVFVLPEESHHKFIVKDGELAFSSTTSVADPTSYNYSPIKSHSHPIDIRIVNQQGKTTHSQTFVKALETEKSQLMKIFNLSNDDYNDLASVAYGIMGNESDFGRSTKYWIKEYDQADVILAKAAKRLFNGQNPFDESVLNTSRGFTQIKDLPNGDWKKSYPNINKSTLGDPKNSAVATMAYLVDAVKVLKNIAKQNAKDPKKVKITKENLVDYLGYIYQGRRGALESSDDPANADFNTYVQKLKKHMGYIEVSQKIE